ncbi:MAG: hypothetical protein HRU03_07210 [Nanoarchaeales archaeon]|nr:hypothetical protein [Nanoarchaeales archaeon]
MINIIKLLKKATITAIVSLSLVGCVDKKDSDFTHLSEDTKSFVSENIRTGKYPKSEIEGFRMIKIYVLEFSNGDFFSGETGRVEFLSKKDAETAMAQINADLQENENKNLLLIGIKEFSANRRVELDNTGKIISIK